MKTTEQTKDQIETEENLKQGLFKKVCNVWELQPN